MKFGEKKHLEKMQKVGLFPFNTITYFSKLEDHNNRGDIFDSSNEFKYVENVVLEVKPVEIKRRGQQDRLLRPATNM